MTEPCCDYRDHSGYRAACSCECHDHRLDSPDNCHDRGHSYCVVCGYSRPRKPRYRIVSATVDGLYYFVNMNTSGLQREHYSIRRHDFWGSSK